MARYTNIKCGNCGHSFTGGHTPGNTSVLGPSKVHCPKCKIFNRTSSKPYSQFNFGDHLVFWIGRVIKMLLLGLVYGGFLGYLTGINNAGIIIGIIGNIIFNYFNIKYQINETEKEEDKLSGLDSKEKYFNIINTEAQTAIEYFNRGWAKRKELGWHKGAIEDYTKAIEMSTNYAFAYYERAKAKQELKDFKGAIEDYTKLIEIDSVLDEISIQTNPTIIIGTMEIPVSFSTAGVYIRRARSKELLKDFKGAIADYTEAIGIDPKRMNSYYSRGWARYYLNDMNGACQDARKADELGLATYNKLSDLACK